jgi:hypothetical protein
MFCFIGRPRVNKQADTMNKTGDDLKDGGDFDPDVDSFFICIDFRFFLLSVG